MTLYLSSIFRDSAHTLDRYFGQVEGLEALRGEPVTLVLAEGDSEDDTFDGLLHHLDKRASSDTLIQVHHGGPKFESVDHPDRWGAIAQVCNAVMDQVADRIADDDILIYVESDLLWEGPTMAALLEGLVHRSPTLGAVAPLSIMQGDGRFYDVWGYRKDGARFEPWPPYHPDLGPDRWVPIDSSGSCFATWGKYARNVRFDPKDCILGVGRTLAAQGVRLWLDQRSVVYHP